MSSWCLRPEFEEFNAEIRFDVESIHAEESPLCIAGEILQGLKKPHHCSAFGKQCTPENPLGATMVSSEGACAAYYKYGQESGSSTCGEITPEVELLESECGGNAVLPEKAQVREVLGKDGHLQNLPT